MPEELKGLTRSVIIGLGGTGQEVVMRLRKLLAAEYGSLDKIPVVRFLVIDTDKNYSVTPGVATGDYQLKENEFIQATIPDPRPIYDGIRQGASGGQQHIGEWFDVEKLGNNVNITEGARSIRQIGRLCFFHNYTKISTALRAIRTEMDPEDLEDTMQARGIQVDKGYNVYIIGSLAGGTGSGMVIDMAYVARKIFKPAGAVVRRIIGVLLMPQAFADTDMSDRKLANGYAALRELNYYTYQGLADDPSGILFRNKRFTAKYNMASADNFVDELDPPFDFCYLINTTNQGNVTLTRNQLFEMIARNLGLEFTSKFAQFKRSMRDNISSTNASGVDNLGSPLNFYSFGLSSIYFPSREIEQALVYKLARAAAARWIALGEQITDVTESAQNVSASMSDYVQDFLRNNKLLEKPSEDRRDLVLSILTDETGASLSQRAAKVKGLVEQRWQEERWNPKEYSERLRRQVAAQEARLKQVGPDEKQWGEWAQRMAANGKKLDDDLTEAVHAKVADMIEDSRLGPNFARQFLDALDETLSAVAGELRDEVGVPRRMAQILGNVRIINDLGGKVPTGLEPSLQEKENALWQQVDQAGRAVMFAEARAREHGSEYLQYATLRLRARCERLARETVNKTLDEFRREGLKEERERLDRVRVFLKQLVGELSRFQNEYEKYTKVLLINGELLYGEEIEQTVERFYREYMPNEEELINLIQKDVLSSPKVAGTAKNVRLLDLPDLADKNPTLLEAIRKAIVARSEAFALELRVAGKKLVDISAAGELVRGKGREEAMRELRPRLTAVYNKSSAFINFETVVNGWGEEQLGKADIVGMNGADAAVSDEEEGNDTIVLSVVSGIVRGRDRVRNIPDTHQILFTREVGSFPLRAVVGMQTLRNAYASVSRQTQQAPLHFIKNAENFPDIFPQPAILTEARRAWIIGVALKIIKLQDGAYVFPYESAGLSNRHLLGEDEQTALMTLMSEDSKDGDVPWRRKIIMEANKMDQETVTQLLGEYRATIPQRNENGGISATYKYVDQVVQDYNSSRHTNAA